MLIEVTEKFPGTGAACTAAEVLFQIAVKDGAPDAALRAAVERFLRSAASFGPAVEQNALRYILRALERCYGSLPAIGLRLLCTIG